MAVGVPNIPDEFHLRRHDRYPFYEIDLYNLCGTALAPTGYDEIVFTMRARDGTLKVNRATALLVVGPDGSTYHRLQYRWLDGDTDTPGRYTAEFEILFTDGKKRTFPSIPTKQPLVINIHDDLDNA
jgi:hypothetical protein